MRYTFYVARASVLTTSVLAVLCATGAVHASDNVFDTPDALGATELTSTALTVTADSDIDIVCRVYNRLGETESVELAGSTVDMFTVTAGSSTNVLLDVGCTGTCDLLTDPDGDGLWYLQCVEDGNLDRVETTSFTVNIGGTLDPYTLFEGHQPEAWKTTYQGCWEEIATLAIPRFSTTPATPLPDPLFSSYQLNDFTTANLILVTLEQESAGLDLDGDGTDETTVGAEYYTTELPTYVVSDDDVPGGGSGTYFHAQLGLHHAECGATVILEPGEYNEQVKLRYKNKDTGNKVPFDCSGEDPFRLFALCPALDPWNNDDAGAGAKDEDNRSTLAQLYSNAAPDPDASAPDTDEYPSKHVTVFGIETDGSLSACDAWPNAIAPSAEMPYLCKSGISFNAGCAQCRFIRNHVHTTEGHCLYASNHIDPAHPYITDWIEEETNVEIAGNFVEGCGGFGSGSVGISSQGSKNSDIHHNTIQGSGYRSCTDWPGYEAQGVTGRLSRILDVDGDGLIEPLDGDAICLTNDLDCLRAANPKACFCDDTETYDPAGTGDNLCHVPQGNDGWTSHAEKPFTNICGTDFHHNVTSHHGFSAFGRDDGNGIDIKFNDCADNPILIRKNHIHHNWAGLVFHLSPEGIVVEGNLIEDNANGITTSAKNNCPVDGEQAFYIDSGTSQVQIVDNVIRNNSWNQAVGLGRCAGKFVCTALGLHDDYVALLADVASEVQGNYPTTSDGSGIVFSRNYGADPDCAGHITTIMDAMRERADGSKPLGDLKTIVACDSPKFLEASSGHEVLHNTIVDHPKTGFKADWVNLGLIRAECTNALDVVVDRYAVIGRYNEDDALYTYPAPPFVHAASNVIARSGTDFNPFVVGLLARNFNTYEDILATPNGSAGVWSALVDQTTEVGSVPVVAVEVSVDGLTWEFVDTEETAIFSSAIFSGGSSAFPVRRSNQELTDAADSILFTSGSCTGDWVDQATCSYLPLASSLVDQGDPLLDCLGDLCLEDIGDQVRSDGSPDIGAREASP